jgi:hypothetical protein
MINLIDFLWIFLGFAAFQAESADKQRGWHASCTQSAAMRNWVRSLFTVGLLDFDAEHSTFFGSSHRVLQAHLWTGY